MDEPIKYDVNIDLANKAKRDMAASMKSGSGRLLHRPFSFSALYDARFAEYRYPVLVLKTEEPGSKQLLAFAENKVESVCFDMINHLVNDCVVMGAKPLSVQDAIICGKLDPAVAKRIVAAIAEACRAQGCELTGGETSEQPGVVPDGTYILTSSIVGIVERDKIIDGSAIKEGDVVLGLASSGLHTNGYTLVRRLLERHPGLRNVMVGGRSFIEEILEPHRCYYHAIEGLFERGLFTGLAHITGGGIRENLDRILPEGLDARIDASSYRILPVFKLIKDIGRVEDAVMLRTFNLGVGMAAVARPKDADAIIAHLASFGVEAYPIGEITSGDRTVRVEGDFAWS
jgi:phosphoribosylformylglycinamidine cyclo-ligase